MAQIQELPAILADQIAAGEVIERPASVVKELVENAIDAHSRRIDVLVKEAGLAEIRVIDDGAGIPADQVPLAFRRHATSKLRTEADLTAIGTLGFRGEALAAISSVTRIDLFTRQKGAIAGLHLHLEAGEIQIQEEAGCPEGTTIVVRDLFYNTPARMKFLKKDFTEAGYILSVVQHAALSHPEIAFCLIRDGKQVFSTDGKGKLMAPVFAVFGKEMTASMIEVPRCERNGMTAYGYIVKPHAGRPNRSMQHFFVNGRYVKSRLMQAALEEAYRNAMITGKYPSGAVFLELPLAAVDVNVHPAKTEVKFSQEKPVFEAVYAACKNAISANDNMPHLIHQEKKTVEEKLKENVPVYTQQRFAVSKPEIPVSPASKTLEPPELEDFLVAVPPRAKKPSLSGTYAAAPRIIQENLSDVVFHRSSEEPMPERKPTPIAQAPFKPIAKSDDDAKPNTVQRLEPLDSGARVIGECFQTYLIAEDRDGLILIDKHAAHERLLFNKLRQETEIPQQELLTPVIVELTGEEASAVESGLEEIRQAGFAIDSFGENSFAVRSVPAYLDSADVPSVIGELAEKLMNSRTAVPDRLDDLIHTVACKAAIKAGKASTRIELQDLCDRVLADKEVQSCPHGRPTTVRLTKYELDKMFKRVNQ